MTSNMRQCLNCGEPLLEWHGKQRREQFHKGCKAKYRKQTHKCACGCGEEIPKYTHDLKPQEFKLGHHTKLPDKKGFGGKGKNHWIWKGGKRVHGDGYRYLWNPRHPFATKEGYVLEHRLAYETYYKCCLLPNCIIHHKNKDKLDSGKENLQLMTISEHSRYHRLNVT